MDSEQDMNFFTKSKMFLLNLDPFDSEFFLLRFQIRLLALRKLSENHYTQAKLIETKVFGSPSCIRVANLFDDMTYKAEKYREQDKRISFAEMMRDPLYNILERQNLFLLDMIADRDGHAIRKMPLFVLANLEALLNSLEAHFNYGGEFELPGVDGIVTMRIEPLISFIKKAKAQINTAFWIEEKELDTFRTQFHDLFSYPVDVIELTYISSSYLSNTHTSTIDSLKNYELATSYGLNPTRPFPIDLL